ncbi:MAG: hypothetical protein ABII09_07905, partial [Planctomycetota bacterium]
MGNQKNPAAGDLRKLPSVDSLLRCSEMENYVAKIGRTVVANSIRQAIDEVREFLVTQASVET